MFSLSFKTLAFFFSLLLIFPLILAPRDANAQLDKRLEGDSPTAFQQLLQNTSAARNSAGYDYSADASIQRAVGRIINYVAGLIGTLLLVIIVYGAYEWMTAAGNDDQISKAKDTIKRAIIGVAILLAAYAITRLVVTTVIYSTQKSIMDNVRQEDRPGFFGGVKDAGTDFWNGLKGQW